MISDKNVVLFYAKTLIITCIFTHLQIVKCYYYYVFTYRKIVEHVDLMTSAEQVAEYIKAFR